LPMQPARLLSASTRCAASFKPPAARKRAKIQKQQNVVSAIGFTLPIIAPPVIVQEATSGDIETLILNDAPAATHVPTGFTTMPPAAHVASFGKTEYWPPSQDAEHPQGVQPVRSSTNDSNV
jgi:hypothetical protein